MNKKIIGLGLSLALSLGTCMTSFAAAGWVQSGKRWMYKINANGYEVTVFDDWYWIDGNADGIAECYCFSEGGYMFADTTTPDGYTVNADGAWVVDGVVQTKEVEAGTYQYSGSVEKAKDAQNTDSWANDISDDLGFIPGELPPEDIKGGTSSGVTGDSVVWG